MMMPSIIRNPTFNARVRQVSQELVDVISAKSPVAFAQQGELGVRTTRTFPQRAPDAMPVALVGFVDHQSASPARHLGRSVFAVVIDYNDALDVGMRTEILHRGPDTGLIVIGGERDGEI